MRIFFDTEFIDTGSEIIPISIGMIREDGKEYYAEFEETDLSDVNDWLKENVVKHLTGNTKPKKQIAEEVRLFCGGNPEFWAWFGSYDWVVLCQLYGRMLDVPYGWPHLYNELVFFVKSRIWSIATLKQTIPNDKAHNALSDAKWNKKVWEFARDSEIT